MNTFLFLGVLNIFSVHNVRVSATFFGVSLTPKDFIPLYSNFAKIRYHLSPPVAKIAVHSKAVVLPKCLGVVRFV